MGMDFEFVGDFVEEICEGFWREWRVVREEDNKGLFCDAEDDVVWEFLLETCGLVL